MPSAASVPLFFAYKSCAGGFFLFREEFQTFSENKKNYDKHEYGASEQAAAQEGFM